MESIKTEKCEFDRLYSLCNNDTTDAWPSPGGINIQPHGRVQTHESVLPVWINILRCLTDLNFIVQQDG
jgi:hypothetical protein